VKKLDGAGISYIALESWKVIIILIIRREVLSYGQNDSLGRLAIWVYSYGLCGDGDRTL
jgi:hypothetical protein